MKTFELIQLQKLFCSYNSLISYNKLGFLYNIINKIVN